METVPEALTTNTVGRISIEHLAELVEVPVEKLRPLVEHEYLRVLVPNAEFNQVIVARPGEKKIQWLKHMFQPLGLRQVIPLKEAAKLFKLTERKALLHCWHSQIPVHSDPVFGYLIAFKSLKRLARAAWSYCRFDRAALLRYYMSQIEGERWKDPPPYSERLEAEIKRVARVPEPMRTIRCAVLIEAFRDARTATQCLRRQENLTEELQKSESQICDLFRRETGFELTWSD